MLVRILSQGPIPGDHVIYFGLAPVAEGFLCSGMLQAGELRRGESIEGLYTACKLAA